jgi:hypothetical protein
MALYSNNMSVDVYSIYGADMDCSKSDIKVCGIGILI